MTRVEGLGTNDVTVTVEVQDVDGLLPSSWWGPAIVLSVTLEKATPRVLMDVKFDAERFILDLEDRRKCASRQRDLHDRLFVPLLPGQRALVLYPPREQVQGQGLLQWPNGGGGGGAAAAAAADNAALLDVGKWR